MENLGQVSCCQCDPLFSSKLPLVPGGVWRKDQSLSIQCKRPHLLLWACLMGGFSLQVTFRVDVTSPIILCNKTYTHEPKGRKKKLKFLSARIREDYMQQWVVDNMPVAWCYRVVDNEQQFCTTRFPIGCYVNDDNVRHDACFISVSSCLLLLSHFPSLTPYGVPCRINSQRRERHTSSTTSNLSSPITKAQNHSSLMAA